MSTFSVNDSFSRAKTYIVFILAFVPITNIIVSPSSVPAPQLTLTVFFPSRWRIVSRLSMYVTPVVACSTSLDRRYTLQPVFAGWLMSGTSSERKVSSMIQ